MSVTLGALVIAISTEFSVLLSERYRRGARARPRAGRGAARAPTARRAPRCSPPGVTAIAGFAVLALSDIRMLRDFGLVTVVDLAVALLGVLVVLPGRARARRARRALRPAPPGARGARAGPAARARARRGRRERAAASPEDPFARWAHRRDPDLDALERGDEEDSRPEGRAAAPGLPAGASRYGWFVGLVGLLVLAYIALNTVRTSGLGGGIPVGDRLPPFAVPLSGREAHRRREHRAAPPRRAPRGVPGGAARSAELLPPRRRASGRARVRLGHRRRHGATARRHAGGGRALPRRALRRRVPPGRPGPRRCACARSTAGRSRSAGTATPTSPPPTALKSLPVVVFGDARRRSQRRRLPTHGLGAAALAGHVRRLGAA